MKKTLIWLAVLVAVGGGAFITFRDGGEGPKFRTEKITKGEIISTVTATGTVNAVTTVLVGTQVSGTVKEIYVDFNSHVKKGQLIALIDPATFEAQVEQQKANLRSAKANVEKAKATLEDAERTMERNRQLRARDLIAQSDLDTSVTSFQTAKAQVAVAEAAVAQAEAALKTAVTNLGYTKIVSPVDGVVVSRNVDVGQTVAASFQTPTLFTIAQDLTKMQIDTNVDEADIGKVKVGQDVEFTVDAYPETMFKGKVSQIRIAPISVENVVTYDVVVLVDNKALKLMPGMTANVSVIVAQVRDVLRIPNAALRFRPAEHGKVGLEKGAGVWIAGERRPVRIPVELGISDGSHTEVISGDLKQGEDIIVDQSSSAKGQARSGHHPRFF
ncbi:MAG: efflux RND transporter periplasmic adaptor subunit [Candidatus Sulfobium sp.]|jgi:HlyD family secretion protein